jgi:hypothetical protein
MQVPAAHAGAVEWLLASDEPAVRYLSRCEVLGERAPDDEAQILTGPKVTALLDGQRPDGGFGGHPYSKWTGAHWRLISLVELGVPQGEPRCVAAADRVLAWLTSSQHRRSTAVIDGRTRRCASQEGAALAVCSRLGLAEDHRVQLLARSLVEWQWPDGGWNCDRLASGHRSSFHESLLPMWGLHEYAVATGDEPATAAADRTAELLLGHRVFRSTKTGQPINRDWLTLHYPAYWHYDVLQALSILQRMGKATDPRADDAREVLVRRRQPDGRWRPGAYWWRPQASGKGNEVVDWGRSGPNEMITLTALRVLSTPS